MSQITEQHIQQKMRSLPDGSPNYEEMWSRIRLEVERRRSGWSEQTETVPEKTVFSRARQWTLAASAAAVIATAAGTAVYLEQRAAEPEAITADPAGQRVDASAEVDGVKLSLDNAVIGYQQTDGTTQMALQMSLSGLEGQAFDDAAFQTATLTDVDSGTSTPIEAFFNVDEGSDRLTLTRYIQENLPAAGEKRQYRLKMTDLHVNDRVEVPLENPAEGKSYEIIPADDFRFELSAYRWTAKDTKLSLEYRTNHAEPVPDIYDSQKHETQVQHRGFIWAKNGDTVIKPKESRYGENGKTEFFDFGNLTGQERNNLQFVYSYAQTVKKVEGEWSIDFTVEGSTATPAAESVPIPDTAALEERTGMTLAEAQVTPFEVRIPVTRQDDSSVLQDGKFMYYNRMILQAGEFETKGMQAPIPGLPYNPIEGVTTDGETMYFGFRGNQLQDLAKEPLTLKLRDALVARVYPDIWTEVQPPSDKVQAAGENMPDGSVMAYKIVRKGKDVQITTPTGGKFYLVTGTRLKVDGQTYEPDPKQSYYRDTGKTGFRMDVFKNVPEGSEFAINAGTYGVYDSSRDIDVQIR